MVIKRGKWLFILFLSITTCLAKQAHIELYTTDSEGGKTSTLQARVPFRLVFNIEGVQNINEDQLKISLPAGCKVLGQESKNTLFVGAHSVRHELVYTMLISNESDITIGPARLETAQGQITSNSLRLSVKKEMVKGGKQFALLSCDKTEVYVGQKLRVTLKFLSRIPTDVQSQTPLDFADFWVGHEYQPRRYKEIYNGYEYEIIECAWDVAPKKSGTLTLGPVGFNVIQPGRSLFAMPSMKKFFSSECSLNAQPVPVGFEYPVGVFNQLKAGIEQKSATQGEGVVYRLTLEGNGLLAGINHPNIVLPEGLSFYESRSYVQSESENSEKQCKIFEYIIQAKSAGDYRIGAQTFKTFNPSTGKVITLTSEPVSLFIAPTNTSKSSYMYMVYDSMPVKKPDSIAWALFALLVLIPLLILMGSFAKRVVIPGIEGWLKRKKTKRFAYLKSSALLAYYERANKGGAIPDVFRYYFSVLIECEPKELTFEHIDRYLADNKFSPGEKKAWKKFYQSLLYDTYSNEKVRNSPAFKAAHMWLSRFWQTL